MLLFCPSNPLKCLTDDGDLQLKGRYLPLFELKGAREEEAPKIPTIHGASRKIPARSCTGANLEDACHACELQLDGRRALSLFSATTPRSVTFGLISAGCEGTGADCGTQYSHRPCLIISTPLSDLNLKFIGEGAAGRLCDVPCFVLNLHY